MKSGFRVYATCLLSLAVLCVWQPGQAALFDLGALKDTAKKIKKASGKVSVEEEVRIGDSVCAQLLGAAPLVKQNSLQQYVNSVGMWVAQQTTRKDLPWSFGVMDSDNINAFATPGGRVLITRGLFFTLESEAELAGVLGHEVAHVIKKHHLNALKKNARLDLLGDALQIAAHDKGGSDQAKLDALLNAGTQLYARGLDRKDEYEADRLGVVYAARAGYDPYALLNVLTTLDSINPASPSLALLTKTHPAFGDRIAQLDIAIENRLDRYATQPLLMERLLQIKQQMIP
jgi:predicted Zn-dependent protease